MGRKEFMEQLAALLSDIPEQEREEALEYYERYFDEAGEDLEQAIKNLGSPQKVAQDMKSGMRGEYFYTERAAENSYTEKNRETPFFYINEEKKETRKKRSFWEWWGEQTTLLKVICFAAALALFFPIVGVILGTVTGVVGAALGILLGAIALLLSIFAGAVAVTVAAYAAGGASIVYGIVVLFHKPVIGLLALGLGCLGIAAGILFTFLSVWLYLKVLPKLIHVIEKLFHKIVGGRRKPA